MILNNLTVLNTRPKNQAASLTQLIKQAGGNVIELPCTDILPPENETTSQQQIQKIKENDIVIVSSANAIPILKKAWPKKNPTMIAIGSGTRDALMNAGFHRVLLPDTFDTEGLLTMPLLQTVAHQPIWICCGKDPRPVLHETLLSRGAKVELVICYQRRCPIINTDEMLNQLKKSHCNVFIFTSPESLTNFANMIALSKQSWLLEIPIIIISEKMQRQATRYQFKNIILASNATNLSILDALNTFCRA